MTNEDYDRFSIFLIKGMYGLIDERKLNDFFEVNMEMWKLEDKISDSKDLKEIGKLYLELRKLTKKRAKLKGEKKTY